MCEEITVSKMIKWIGVAVLVTIPIYFVSKYIAQKEKSSPIYDDENIFASELE